MELSSSLITLLIVWGVVTGLLVCLWIYRATLENHEDTQIFLDQAGESMAKDQRTLGTRIDRLSKPIMSLMVLSGVLILVIAGLWLYGGLKNF